MSAMFTQHALERMRQGDVSSNDIAGLLATVERVADNPTDSSRWGEVVRVQGDTFIVRGGDLRAIVSVNPGKLSEVVVMTVYQAKTDRDVDASPSSPTLQEPLQSPNLRRDRQGQEGF